MKMKSLLLLFLLAANLVCLAQTRERADKLTVTTSLISPHLNSVLWVDGVKGKNILGESTRQGA